MQEVPYVETDATGRDLELTFLSISPTTHMKGYRANDAFSKSWDMSYEADDAWGQAGCSEKGEDSLKIHLTSIVQK